MAKEGSTVSGLMDASPPRSRSSLQHGVPLKVLCEKFAHTRFEPSGWTGNEQIGYAKCLMDYIFRWLQLRFLSGQQLSLFAGLAAPRGFAGHSPSERVSQGHASPPTSIRPHGVWARPSAPQGGILPEIQATGYESSGVPHIEDRGVYHAADAMKGLYDMGDAPSCHTCGAIMVRNGSCYRCMSCGSTSGCS